MSKDSTRLLDGEPEAVDHEQGILDVMGDAGAGVKTDEAHDRHGRADNGNGEAVADGHEINILLKAAQAHQQAQAKEDAKMGPVPHSVLLLSKVALDVLCKALVADAGVAHQIVAQGPLGEEDDVMLAGLLDLGQVCQNREHPDRAVLDDACAR